MTRSEVLALARAYAGAEPLQRWVDAAKDGPRPDDEVIADYLADVNPYPDETEVDLLDPESGEWRPAVIAERTDANEWAVEFDDEDLGWKWADYTEIRFRSGQEQLEDLDDAVAVAEFRRGGEPTVEADEVFAKLNNPTQTPAGPARSDDTSFTTRRLAEQLRDWAAGLYGTEAAVELLIRAWHGKLLAGPWIRNEDGAVWFDPAGIDQAGYLSSGERRLLEVAGSLANNRPVALGDAAFFIGRDGLELVLAAIAHAAGSHHHSRPILDDQGVPTGFEPLASLYPWPDDDEGGQA